MSGTTTVSGRPGFNRPGGPTVGSALGWAIVAILAAIALARALHADDIGLVIAAIALTPWAFALAWPVAAYAAWSRRRALAVVSAVLVGLHLWWVLPQFDPIAHGPRAAPGARRLTVFDANVHWTNTDMRGIAGEIKRDHPDLVALEEVTPGDINALAALGALTPFTWSVARPSFGSDGVALWSRARLLDGTVWDDAGHPAIRATVAANDGPGVTVLVVHTYIPFSGLPPGLWKAELREIAAQARQTPRPLIVVGDFNATWDMYEFQDILHTGLSDSAVLAGRGWEMTWTRRLPIIPPFVRIDHLLVSPNIAVTAFRLGIGEGSDHRPIVVSLAVNPNAVRPAVR